MTNVEKDVQGIMARVRLQTADRISDEVARVLFEEWKRDASMSIGDLFRAVEAKGRQEARDESEAIARGLYDSPSARSAAVGAAQAIHRGVAA